MKIEKMIKSTLEKIANKAGYKKPKKTYQDSRFPEDQYNLISNTNEYKKITNSLEIGCNKGILVKMFARDGIFAAGLDLTDHWAFENNEKAILGTYPINEKSIDNVPEFDSIALLSVHHQWVKSDGDKEALKLIKKIASKAKICTYIEFAAISEKYGYKENEKFIDNDENSVTKYANNWLSQEFKHNQIEYLGKTRELEKKEPYRFLFIIRNYVP